jgi:colanic acid/amylovoran biosynthesis glycosyltransferase
MKRPLRIAVLVGTFPVVSETFILRQINGLIDLGHEVDIYADTRGDERAMALAEVTRHRLLARTVFMDLPPAMIPWEMPVWPLTGETWIPGATEAIPNWKRWRDAAPVLAETLVAVPALACATLRPSEYGYQAASLSALHRLARCVERGKTYDVLHAHFGPVGNRFRFARRLWNAPMVVSFHGYDFSSAPRLEGAGMYARLFAEAEMFTVNSDYTRGCIEALGCPAEKIRALPVGLDVGEFSCAERRLAPGEPVRVLTVGRLVEKKGVEDALRAVAMARANGVALRYEVIGEGPLRPRLQALIEELNLGDVVELLGARDGRFVREKMAAAHVFLLSSVTAANGDVEGQGLVLQEAQACGLPLLVTRHGPFPEGVLPGESARLVAERDPEALGRELIELARHPEVWPEMGRAGRRFVEARFDIHKLSHRQLELYGEVLTGGRAS